MSSPATTGSAASAATGVKPSPSCACNSSRLARSRATPTTCAPAPASAMAMPRLKPRLAPVTSAVDPDSSCADIRYSLILGSERVSRGYRYRSGRWPEFTARRADEFRAVRGSVPVTAVDCATGRAGEGRGDAGQRGVRTADRAVPARVAGALLPDARLGLRRRRPGAGDPGPRLAVLQ